MAAAQEQQRRCLRLGFVCLRAFLRSRGGSFSALMTSADAEGMTDTLAMRFCTVSFTVTRRPFQSLAVSFAMSSPIFLGDRPRGPASPHVNSWRGGGAAAAAHQS